MTWRWFGRCPWSHLITVTIVGGPFAGTNRAVVNVVPGFKS